MKTFVLVHGSWHSAWNWHRVIPILEAQGHQALAVDLPGMGRDKTPIGEVTMQRSVQALSSLLENLPGKVVLLAHSKNGVLISQVAEYLPHKIEVLVYLAAYLVPNGKTQREYSLQDVAGVLKPYVHWHAASQSSTLDAAIYREGLYADCEDYIVQLARLLLSHEPIATATTPLELSEAKFGSVPRVYIECTEDKAVTPFIQRKMYTEMPCKKVYQLPSSHSPFFSMPEALCRILCEL